MKTAEDLSKLTLYIEENLRADQKKGIQFVDPRQLRDRVLTRQNHVVFGRRGAGKTTLLSSIAQNENAVTVYVNLESAKDGALAATQARVLEAVFEQLRLKLKQKKTGFFLRMKIKKAEKVLKRLNQKETDDELKKDALNKNAERSKALFNEISAKLEGRPLYLALDDFYFISQELQPEFLDYFHRLTKDTELYLKVGTVRDRSSLYCAGKNSYRGVEIGHDAHEIDIDYTLEKFAEMENFFHELLESANRESGANVELDRYFRGDGFKELCRASEGVPRNFLGLFVRLANRHKKDEDPNAFIGVEEILEQIGGAPGLKKPAEKKPGFFTRWWTGLKSRRQSKEKAAAVNAEKKRLKRSAAEKLRVSFKQIKKMQKKARKLDDEMREECLADLKSYRENEPAAWQHLNILQKSNEQSFGTAKQELEKIMNRLEDQFKKAEAYFV